MSEIREFFLKAFDSHPEQLAFAPGRIEFIGNHTDYNGGLVMGAALSEGITVAVKRRADRSISLVSEGSESVALSLDQMESLTGVASWANYPVGMAKILAESGMVMEVGFDMAVISTLPVGAGMSSSAALELATAYALSALYGFKASKIEFVRMARKAENEFVGMPCGILDQGVSVFGQRNSLVRIDCTTEKVSINAFPAEAHFWLFNSNVKHALVDSAYAERHRECQQALDILRRKYPEARTLTEITREQLECSKADLGDLLFRRAAHIVGENNRVHAVASALEAGDLATVGQILNASHESSRLNFENSTDALDFLAEAIHQQPHVYGARLTGGGFGGAVMAFTDPCFSEAQADQVMESYRKKFGFNATLIHTGTGDGARLLDLESSSVES